MDLETTTVEVERGVREADQRRVANILSGLGPVEAVQLLERLNAKRRVTVFLLLSKEAAPLVFERLDPELQRELILRLEASEAAAIFATLRPEDRARLLDITPARTAERLLAGLPPAQQETTSALLRYPRGTIGHWMRSDPLSLHPELTAAQALGLVRDSTDKVDTLCILPVADAAGRLIGVVTLPDVIGTNPRTHIADIMRTPESVRVDIPAEEAARRCADLKLLAVPVVDEAGRLVGSLTVADALRILEDAESEDTARAGGSEPLRRPYLATPVMRLVRSRVVWLLMLAVSAILTVQVLEIFEATLEQMVVLALFIPLLTGTGGNTGNQAATTVTRALALGDVRIRDMGKVLLREVRVGAALGVMLGGLGFALASIFYGAGVGLVIGLTLLSVCTMAATVGGAMPLIGKSIRVDPAVFSNPFISTFCDATGLVMYFLIARTVLNL